MKRKYLSAIAFLIVLSFLFTAACSKEDSSDSTASETKEVIDSSNETEADSNKTSGDTSLESEGTEVIDLEEEVKFPPADSSLLFPDRYPFAFMINNVAAARPQSGLDKAKIIYQLMTEGRTTRLLLLTDETEGIVGPVRSARPAFLELAAQHQAFYSHAGNFHIIAESPVGDMIKSIDALKGHYSTYYRSSHRKSPHNLYITLEKAYARAEKIFEQIQPETEVEGLYIYNDFQLPPNGAAVNKVEYSFSKLKESFRYDAEKKIYYKYNDQELLVDEQSEKALEISNIIILHRPHDLMPNGVHNKIDWLDTAEAVYLTGGQQFTISWEKKSHQDPIRYYLEGAELVFNPGLIWIVVVDDRAQATVNYSN